MITSVSTKTGDDGQSGLANGQRLGKDELLFEVLGTQDEVNAWIGCSLAQLSTTFTEQKQFLLEVQDTLFYIGAELARSPKVKLTSAKLKKLEQISEDLQQKMGEEWTTKFLLPGGTETAAVIDVTRTIIRRLERLVVKLSRQQTVSPLILQYINRLSDFFYVLRCWVNVQEGYVEKPFVATP